MLKRLVLRSRHQQRQRDELTKEATHRDMAEVSSPTVLTESVNTAAIRME